MEKKVELKVLNITDSMAEAGAFAMLLGEVNGERQLPIIIGPAEAQSTLLHLHGIHAPRPLTHDLLISCLEVLQTPLTKILIYKAEEGIFCSYIYLKHGDDILRIDSRTSDAVALAVRTNCPILIYDHILEKECIKRSDCRQKEEQKELEDSNEPTSLSTKLIALEAALDKAIKNEDYESAALIRDKIKLIK